MERNNEKKRENQQWKGKRTRKRKMQCTSKGRRSIKSEDRGREGERNNEERRKGENMEGMLGRKGVRRWTARNKRERERNRERRNDEDSRSG